MNFKISLFDNNKITYPNMMEIYQGWQAYVKWANTYKLRKQIRRSIIKVIMERLRKQDQNIKAKNG